MGILDKVPGVGFLRRLWGVGVYRVMGRSMEPSYFDGEVLVVWAVGEDLGELRRGDVVLFRHPSVEGRLMLKRVAALPGERVSLVVDRVVVEEVTGMDVDEGEELWGAEWVLGADEWFVVGDNLGESLDSRRLGPIRGSWIRGRVWFRYWPWLRM